MKTRNLLSLIMFLCVILTTASCKREPLTDEIGNLQMQIAIDYNIKHTADVPEPEVMYVGFYDTETGVLRSTEFTGPHGGEIFVDPGMYDILTYNFDTEFTLIRNSSNIKTIEAYTNTVPSDIGRGFRSLAARLAANAPRKTRAEEYGTQPVINQPDHLFAGVDDAVDVPVRSDIDETFVVYTDASTLLETYELKINNIKGLEYVASAEVYITGQAQSKMVASREFTGEPCILYVPIKQIEGDQLVATFRTFGKYPGAENKVTLILKLTDYEGNIIVLEEDVTDQFDDPDNDDDEITITTTLEIEPTETSGLAPAVTIWDENVRHIKV